MLLRSQRGAMPTWAKILVGLLAVGLLCITVLLIIGGTFIQQIGKQATDPKAVAKSAQEIVHLKQPLPAGWEYKMALNMGPMGKTLMMMNTKDRTIINFMRYPAKFPTQRVMEGQANGSHVAVAERGVQDVAGQRMEFMRGAATTNGGIRMKVQLGCLTTKTGEPVIIQAWEPDVDKFDATRISPILDRIEGF